MPIGISEHKRVGMWSQENLRQVVDWLEAAYPLEGCGLVLEKSDGTFRVRGCENLADAYHALDPQAYPQTGRVSYVLDPMEIVRAERCGERMVVIFHSHPDADDDFSEDDMRGAVMPRISGDDRHVPSYPDVDYLVVSVCNARAERATLFRFDEEQEIFVAAAVFGEARLQNAL